MWTSVAQLLSLCAGACGVNCCILLSMDNKTASILAVSLGLIAGAFAFGLQVGAGQVPMADQVAQVVQKDGDPLTAGPSVDTIDFTPYWRVWNTLERKFIPFGTTSEATSSIALEDRLYGSIEGLVKSYDDPYTVFMRPKVSEEFKIATKGSLEGIGSVIGERDGKLLVVQPLEGSPAEKAGLLPEDTIQEIDGTLTEGMTVQDAVSLIRGERGTEVVLTIGRSGEESQDIPIIRGTIEIPSTRHAIVEREVPIVAANDSVEAEGNSSSGDAADSDEEIVPDEDELVQTETKSFYMLRLFSFSQSSVNAFERELVDFVESGSDSLIIDLRGNPGGYLEAAVNMAGWFLPEGTIVVRELRGPDKAEIVHRTKRKPLVTDTEPNIAVVVDGSSASASEILAGALQEHGVATVVGVNTFGKGSVQELVSISDELSLKVTIARWFTPNGVSISEGGLTPDILVDVENASSADPFIDAAVDVLAGM